MVPTDLHISLLDLEKHDYKMLITTKDTPLLYWTEYNPNAEITETGKVLRKGSMINYDDRHDSCPIPTYEVHQISNGMTLFMSNTRIPVTSAMILSSDERDQLVDILYPPFKMKSKSIAASHFRFFPTFQDTKSASGGFSEKEIEVDVLRRTQDNKWFFVRYWDDSYNVWLKGWVPSTAIDVKISSEVKQVKTEGTLDNYAEAEAIKIKYGVPVYGDMPLYTYKEERHIAITQVDTPAYTYQVYGGKKAEETPYTLKKGSLFSYEKEDAKYNPFPIYASRLWFNGARRDLFIPEKNIKIVSAIDREKLIDLLYPRLSRQGKSTGKVSLKELPDMSSLDIDEGFSKNESKRIEVVRRTTDYKWYYISYLTKNSDKEYVGWVPADAVELEAEVFHPATSERKQPEGADAHFEIISEKTGNF